MHMRGIFLGIGIVVLAALVVYAVWFKSTVKTQIRLKGIIGSEKNNFLENEKVKQILKDKYGITVDYSRAGSIEMVRDPVKDDIDFLWPSSQVALEIFKMEQSKRLVKSDLIFNSPIVIYSWDIVVKALVDKGLVKKENDVYYITNMPGLINDIREGKKWSDMGLGELYGKMNIITTDPTKSNSGTMYAGLLADIMNGDVVNDERSLDTLLPALRDIFNKQGFQQTSSGFLFEQFLKTGVGQYPMIAGYENQIIEFSILHKEFWPKVNDKIKILYPLPTVWSEHPVMALDKKAIILLDALKDEEIQKIAWEQHGFRTGLLGVQNDPKIIKVSGISESIKQTVPVPRAALMEKIIKSISDSSR
jgi:hypothetical protein